MAKRMILMLVLMTVFIGVLGLVKMKQFQAMAGQFEAMQPPPEAVTTIVAQRENWPATLSAIGTIAAVQGVTVSADLPGIVARIGFDSGRTIQRKTIRAPFSGVLGIRQVNLGQYLNAGDPVVPLQSLNPIYVNFGVPQQDAAQMRPGREVRITVGDLGGTEFNGRITAVDSVVDETTRN